MIYRIKTNSGVKHFAVKDGQIVSNDLREPAKWLKEMGGLDLILSKAQPTEFTTLEEASKSRREELKLSARRQKEAEQKKDREKELAYRKLLEENRVIPMNPDNIRIVLAYLNTVNWGLWELPETDRPAVFRQYDCDGHIVTTLSLETPVEYRGMPVKDFKHGTCPRGHLTKYTSI